MDDKLELVNVPVSETRNIRRRESSFHDMRAIALCLLGLALTFCGPSAAVAKQVKKKPSACQKLKQNHKDLASSRKLVVASRGGFETGRISACVLPRGKVRTLASWDDGLGRDFANVVDTAGTWVLVEAGWRDQYGGASLYLGRIEVRHNKQFEVTGYSCNLWYVDGSTCPEGSDYGRVGIARNGAGALEFSDYEAGTTTLQAFNPAGTFTKLADGQVQALNVTSTEIRWKQADVKHTVPLPE